ncbi:hypothetical protein V6Z12_A02G063300 [Gossypium hirsutum]
MQGIGFLNHRQRVPLNSNMHEPQICCETDYSDKSKSLYNKSIRYITMHLYTCFQNQTHFIPNNNTRTRLPRVRLERGIKIYFHKRPNWGLPSHLRTPHKVVNPPLERITPEATTG